MLTNRVVGTMTLIGIHVDNHVLVQEFIHHLLVLRGPILHLIVGIKLSLAARDPILNLLLDLELPIHLYATLIVWECGRQRLNLTAILRMIWLNL